MQGDTQVAQTVPPPSGRRLAAAQIIGTTIEWYDFFIYGTASALVFNKVFFPGFSPLVGTILALATFGAGFLARPVGAVIFGYIGDRVGRKRALVATLLLMGTSTVLVGLLPSHASAGLIAPFLLLALRIIQGIAVGGEWGGAALIGIEHANPQKKALFGSFAQIGSPLGLVLATCAFVAVSSGSDAWLESWGWRIPFLASLPLIPIGLVIRKKIAESPEFLKLHEDEAVKRKAPVVEVVRHDWLRLLIGIGAFSGIFVTYYLFTTFVQVYATSLGMSKSISLPANLIAAISEGVFILLGALASLRYPPRTIALVGAVGLLVWAFPGFALINTASPAALYWSVAISMAAVGTAYGVLAAQTAQLFKPSVRYTGMSLCYHLASALGGGLAPVLATYLLDATGSIWGIAAFSCAIAALMTVACLALPRDGASTTETVAAAPQSTVVVIDKS